MSKLILLPLLMPAFLSLHAADLGVKVVRLPRESMPGIPVRFGVEITNVSDHSLKLAFGARGFRVKVVQRNYENRQLVTCATKRPMINDYIPGYRVEELPPGTLSNYQPLQDLACVNNPGDFIITVEATSTGPYMDGNGNPDKDASSYWTGAFTSPEYRFTIHDPQEVDRAVDEKFQHYPAAHEEEIIRDYPSSTYAGYALMHRGITQDLSIAANLSVAEQGKQLESIGSSEIMKTTKNLNERRQLMHDPGHRSDRLKLGQKRMEGLLFALLKFLEAHPNSELCPPLRKQAAVALFFLGRQAEAMEQVKQLATKSGKEADEARALLKAKMITSN